MLMSRPDPDRIVGLFLDIAPLLMDTSRATIIILVYNTRVATAHSFASVQNQHSPRSRSLAHPYLADADAGFL